MRNLFNEFGGRAGPLLMLVAALAGFFFLLDLLVSLFSSGPPDLLAVNPSDDKTIGLPNGAGIFTFAIAAVAIIIGVVALASPQHWVLRRGVPRPRRSLAVGAVVALVVTGAGLYLAFSGLLDPEIPYEQHQAQRKWLEPAGLVVLAGFFLSVAIVGIVSPRFLLLPLAAWLAAAIVFGWLGSSALAGLSLIERPAKLETPSAYAAEVDRYRRTVDSSPTTIPWDVSIPLETGGAVLTRGDSQLLLVPGTTVLHTQNPVPNPLFTITGSAHTSFLRSATGDVYENGTWTQLDPVEVGIVPGVDVPGAVRDFIRAGMDEQLALLSPRRLELSLLGQPTVEPVTTRLDHITASPAGELKTFEAGLLPTSAVLQGVNIAGVFRPFSATFQNPESASSYAWDSKVAEFSQRQLIGAGPARDPTYLVLPADLPEGIRVLAQEITAGLESPYEKAKAIERHLRDEYSYRLPPGGEGQSLPPEGRDPVDWFLSEHHEGGSGSFSSAFVLLARAAGVPARVVSGWAIAPYEGTQTVHGDQAHQWGEIALEGVGWITFDPTPNGAPSRVRLLPVLDGPREEPEEPAAPAPQDEDSVLDTALVELATSPDPTVRAAAAGLLGEIGGDLPFAALVHAWSADPVRDVRRAAMESLAVWDLEELIRVLLEHDNPLMRTAAAHALGVRGDARALDALLAALAADEEAGVRGAAATALGELGERDAAPALVEGLQSDESSEVREAAAEALGDLLDSEALHPLLMAREEDESVAVQSAAAGALNKFGSHRLVEALRNSDSVSTRAAAAQVLGERGNPSAVPPLIEALSDPSADVRAAAKSAAAMLGEITELENGSAILSHSKGVSLLPGATSQQSSGLPHVPVFEVTGAAGPIFFGPLSATTT